MKLLGNERMDVTTPSGAVMSRETGDKEVEPSAKNGDGLIAPVGPILNAKYSS